MQRSRDGLVTVCKRCARGVDLAASDAAEAIAAVARRAPIAERRALSRRLLARRTMHAAHRERHVDLRIVTLEVLRRRRSRRDNVTVKVNAVVYFRVVDSEEAVVKVLDYVRATSLIGHTTLRSILGVHGNVPHVPRPS